MWIIWQNYHFGLTIPLQMSFYVCRNVKSGRISWWKCVTFHYWCSAKCLHFHTAMGTFAFFFFLIMILIYFFFVLYHNFVFNMKYAYSNFWIQNPRFSMWPSSTHKIVVGTSGRLPSRYLNLFWRHFISHLLMKPLEGLRKLTRHSVMNFCDWKHQTEYFETTENI